MNCNCSLGIFFSESPDTNMLFEFKSSIDSLRTEISQVRSALAENQNRILRNSELLENYQNFGTENLKSLEKSIQTQIEETLEKHGKILKHLYQQQQEQAEKLWRDREEIWKIRMEEVDQKFQWISVQLRFPIGFSTWRHLFFFMAFLVAWPIVIRNIWSLFGGRWVRRLVLFLDYFYHDSADRSLAIWNRHKRGKSFM